jgi:iron complex transport system ATP-binding protein
MNLEQWPQRPNRSVQERAQRPRRPSGFYRTPKLFGEYVDAGYPASEALVLRKLSLEIGDGDILALVGPNGSGKSTLLRALGRVLKPRQGTVYLDGRAMRDWPTRDVARRLSLLPQGPTLASDLTVHELVWLLLDEPTTFLDLNHQLEVLDLIRYLNREHGLTVVMVLHDLNQAARYAKRIVVLKEGEIYADGPPVEVVTPETLRAVFGVEGRVLPGPDGIELVVVPIDRV